MADKRNGGDRACRCRQAHVDCVGVVVQRLGQERVLELAEEIWTASGAVPASAWRQPHICQRSGMATASCPATSHRGGARVADPGRLPGAARRQLPDVIRHGDGTRVQQGQVDRVIARLLEVLGPAA